MVPRFKIRVRLEFSAAHHIPGYEGDCARPHGHNFKVDVEAIASKLNTIGIAVDFRDLKACLKSVLSRFDHQNLNDLPPFNDVNPTAEVIARVLFEEITSQIGSQPALNAIRIQEVTVWETDTSCASFGYDHATA